MHLFSSLKNRVLFNLFLALIPAAVIIYLNIWYEYRTDKSAVLNNVKNTVEVLVNEQLESVDEVRLILRELSHFDELQDPSSQACSDTLSSILALNPQLINIGVPSANGDFLRANPTWRG